MHTKILLTSLFLATNLLAQNLTVLSSPPRSGTFYLASEPDWPPLPCDPYPGLPVTVISNGIYFIDDLQVAAAKEMLQTLNADSLTPPGGGTNGGEAYSDSFNYQLPTNGFYLTMDGITNGQVYITAHNVIQDWIQLLSKTNLEECYWSVEDGSGWVPSESEYVFTVDELDPGATNSHMFFWGAESDTLVDASGSGDAVRPSPGFAPVPQTVTVTRNNADENYASNLVVHFSLSGTASNGVDYVLTDPFGNPLTNSVTIPEDQQQATIYLNPTTNLLCLSNLTVNVTLEDNPNYLVDNGGRFASINIGPNVFSLVATVPGPCGMDYHPPTQSLIVSSQSGNDWTFQRIDANGVVAN